MKANIHYGGALSEVHASHFGCYEHVEIVLLKE